MKYRTIRKYALFGLYYHTMIYGQSEVAITYSYFMGILGPHQRMSGKWLHFFDGSEPINHNQTHRRAIDAEEIKPMANICNECGYPLQGNEASCPECGCPVKQPLQQQSRQDVSMHHDQHQPQKRSSYCAPTSGKTDWAQYVYECSVIAWKTFKKYACFKGRASRREYWSFWAIAVVPFIIPYPLLIVLLLPWFGVTIRRLHDTGKCGWWCFVPFANVFLLLKRSDEGPNEYGAPNPAKNLL